MARNNNFTSSINPNALLLRVAIGAVIGLSLIAFFISGADDAKPEWGDLWMIKPFILVPLSGAAGGAFFYLLSIQFQTGWKRGIAITLGSIGFLVALWLGTVLGLNGTYWN